MIVEMKYEKTLHYETWIPLRTRPDKMFPQESSVANNIWDTITNPVLKEYIEGKKLKDIQFDEDKVDQEAYYINNSTATIVDKPLRDFHNYLKRLLIEGAMTQIKDDSLTILDTSIGRGGDLNKYFADESTHGKEIKFLLGLDISSNVNEAARRFYKEYMKKGKAMFLQYDTSKSIIKGDGLINKEDKPYYSIIFEPSVSVPKKFQKVKKKYNTLVRKDFSIISSQFSFHYYFETEEIFRTYVQNISDMCKKEGYFIGTCYDGNRVFDVLKDKDMEMEDELGNVVYSIKKDYELETFDYNSEEKEKMFGNKIKVYMSSIGQEITEYLVNFEMVEDIMKEYGFEKVELKHKLIGDGISSFESVLEVLDKLKEKDKFLRKNKSILSMKKNVNKPLYDLSCLNNWFIFQKK